MVRLQLELDKDASARLVERKVAGRRLVSWRAELLLRQAPGLSSSPNLQEHREQGGGLPGLGPGSEGENAAEGFW